MVTDWVASPLAIKGQDHLGTMAPATALYSQLLPGITNVTQRARAYSFYPWLLWAIETGGLPRDPASVLKWVRRAECLWCLIGMHHGAELEEPEHGSGITGRDRLGGAWTRISEGERVRLSTYAGLEPGEHRYFKSPAGGFGQYYLPTLRELRIASGDPVEGLVFDETRGTALAKALDGAVDRKLFLKAVQEDVVSRRTLEALKPCCPCALARNRPERDLLLDLFFNRPGSFFSEFDSPRPLTLGLMLDLAGQLEGHPKIAELGLDSWTFRACVYTGALGPGRAWQPRAPLEAQRRLWGVFQRADLLSLATQGIFWVTLRMMERAPVRFPDAQTAANWVAQEAKLKDLSGPRPFDALLKQVRLPALEDWSHEDHEMELAAHVREAKEGDGEEEDRQVLARSLRILLALCRRRWDENPYDGFAIDPEYASRHPINLRSLADLSGGAWTDLSARDWTAWLAAHWGVDTHLRVGLRKLRHERRDTFRVKPGERGLEVVEPVRPAFTNPRLSRARRILLDLSLLRRAKDGRCLLHADGVRLLQDLWP